MKYRRLTKEQLEEMHQEFINFLATQSITAQEWKSIKENKPEVAEEEIDVFSDLVWEGVLAKIEFLENISATQMHLFHLTEKQMNLIAVRVSQPGIDLRTQHGFGWFKQNFMGENVEIMTAVKAYSEDKLLDKFELIEKGAIITKGELFRYFDDIIE
ncbi:hypothetical protein I215_05817 [Galbibacter marinus]|uniref:Histidyl-tRNA synthetase n=1 Tax=Galbibacter marinus TaxID=555500 RepID=K2QLR6_9FLAO|nr:DUF6495 family protein [Galbibacter marinus]EKF55727.1 hypothetical protein I215_05817 [Galbibacter marinus]